MKIIYISGAFDDEIFTSLFTKSHKPMQAANKYHRLIGEGLAENGIETLMYSVLPLSRTFSDKLYIRIPEKKDGKLTKKYISVFNIPVLRHIMLFLKCFFKLAFASKDTVLIYDVLSISGPLGAVLGASLTGKKKIGIVTDLPQFLSISKNSIGLYINSKLVNGADGYVFLTEQMDGTVNKAHKPFIVLEGHVDYKMKERIHKSFHQKKKVVMYAGSLKKIYGISSLCEAFMSLTKNEDMELHIYGDGNFVPDLLELCKKNNNIIYFGNRVNTEIVEAELKATLLVNPRPTEGEYTKFSFPSKTLEYMVSGTPVLSSHLAGIPKEYDEYLYYFDDTKEDGLQTALNKVLHLSEDELEEKGKKAKEFVLSEKTNIVQAKKIIEFINRQIVN